MVSLLFLPSVLPRNFIRAELYSFIFTEPLFFPLGSRNSFYLFPDTRNFSYWLTQLIAPVFGSLTHRISRNLITHFSTAQRKAGRQHTKDHHDTGEWFNSLVGTWLFNWESVGLGLPSWFGSVYHFSSCSLWSSLDRIWINPSVQYTQSRPTAWSCSGASGGTVSYTHLTLPTIYSV